MNFYLLLDLLVHKIFVFTKYPFRSFFSQTSSKSAQFKFYPELDVLMPLLGKDLITARLAIKALRLHSLNPIRNIYIISPNDKQIISFCNEYNLFYINEESILPISVVAVDKLINKKEKRGWFIQQLLKLNSNTLPNLTENYLIMDADTILLKSQYFYTEKHTILKFSDEFHFLYKITNQNILGKFHNTPCSFIAHHMVFNKSILADLKIFIEEKHHAKWYMVILEKANIWRYFFSEYELYAQYALKNYPELFKIQYWFNLNQKIENFNGSIRETDNSYLSVSFHNYKR